MTVSGLIGAELAVALGASVGKFLLKHYLGEFAEAAGGFVEFGKDKLKDTIKDARAARRVELEHERIGADVVKLLESDLQSAILASDEPRPDANKILRRYHALLSGRLAADFVIRNQLDPQKLTDALR